MNTGVARREPEVQGRDRSSESNSVPDRIAELEQRVLAMDRQGSGKPAYSTASPRGNVSVIRTVDDFESRLPQLIEQEVTARFQQMAATLQRVVEETNINEIEVFVKNVQTKLIQRISLLEANMNKQAEAMCELRACSQRTDDNLVRLISGVEKLARELPARLAARS